MEIGTVSLYGGASKDASDFSILQSSQYGVKGSLTLAAVTALFCWQQEKRAGM